MRNTKPPKKSKLPKTNHPAVAESPPEAMIMDQKDASLAEFAAVTADVCRGLHSYLRIVEQNATQKSPTVSHHHSAALQCWVLGDCLDLALA
ncbi:hypothetical protein ACVBEF_13780 [Glaciimonas sp. GG7]